MKVLGIETSCDETAIAIVEDGRRIINDKIFSQVLKHGKWGGVIPEFASRMHLEIINDLCRQCLDEAELKIEDIDYIAVTQGPGLIGSLMVGVHFAKVLSWLHKKPLIAVNHLHGHIAANYLDSELEPPFICMLASGGHTQIIDVSDYNSIEIVGETVDDAAGEAFDKVARLMELNYPGGPEIDKLAQTAADPKQYTFPIAQVDGYNFSFSGLKTAVLRLKQQIGDEIWARDKANIAAAFQDCVARTFYKKVSRLLEEKNYSSLVIAGGVAANSKIRTMFEDKFSKQNGYNLVIPKLRYCTDNAAMIAAAAYFYTKKPEFKPSEMDFEVYSRA